MSQGRAAALDFVAVAAAESACATPPAPSLPPAPPTIQMVGMLAEGRVADPERSYILEDGREIKISTADSRVAFEGGPGTRSSRGLMPLDRSSPASRVRRVARTTATSFPPTAARASRRGVHRARGHPLAQGRGLRRRGGGAARGPAIRRRRRLLLQRGGRGDQRRQVNAQPAGQGASWSRWSMDPGRWSRSSRSPQPSAVTVSVASASRSSRRPMLPSQAAPSTRACSVDGSVVPVMNRSTPRRARKVGVDSSS